VVFFADEVSLTAEATAGTAAPAGTASQACLASMNWLGEGLDSRSFSPYQTWYMVMPVPAWSGMEASP